MSLDSIDWTDNTAIDELRRQIARDDKQVLVETLKSDLSIPLPEDLEKKAKAVAGRDAMTRQIQALNDVLKTPSIEIAKLQEIEVTDRRWMAYPLLPESEVTLLTGQGGVGKSFLMLQIACLLAAGYTDASLKQEKLAGGTQYHYFVQPEIKPNWGEPQPVVYASYEDDMSEIRRRINYLYNRFDWVTQHQSQIFENFHPISMRQLGPVWAPELGKHWQTRSQPTRVTQLLKNECEGRKAKLLMIDPLSACFYGDENNKAEVYAFINSWASWAEDTETAVLISGHLPKSKEARKSGFSGTAAWEGAVRSLFTLDKFDMNEDENGERKKDGTRKLPIKSYLAIKGIKGNYAPTDKVEIPVVRGKYGWIECTGKTELDEAREESHKFLSGQKTPPQEGTRDDTEDNPYAAALLQRDPRTSHGD